jgi:hypothetical protein
LKSGLSLTGAFASGEHGSNPFNSPIKRLGCGRYRITGILEYRLMTFFDILKENILNITAK